MQGSKYSDEQREQARALLAGGMTVTATARAMRIPKQTISFWKAKLDEGDEDFKAARTEEKRRLVKRCYGIVQKSLTALDKRVGAALLETRDIDKVVLAIMTSGEIDAATAKRMVEIVREYTGTSMSELARVMGVVFDRQTALDASMDESGGQVILADFGGNCAYAE